MPALFASVSVTDASHTPAGDCANAGLAISSAAAAISVEPVRFVQFDFVMGAESLSNAKRLSKGLVA